MTKPFDSSMLNRFDLATQYEWLETNGLGGYASSTIIGTNTRRYHGLLVAATQAPVSRKVLVSKMDEQIHMDNQVFELGCNKYQGAIFPNGYIFQQGFQREIFPEFEYQLPGIRLKKTIAMIHGENSTVISYEVLEAERPFTLSLTPLLAFRDHHALSHANDHINSNAYFENDTLRFCMYEEGPETFIHFKGARYTAMPDWYYNFEYQEELKRGLEGNEDLFSPGKLHIDLAQGDKIALILSTEERADRDPLNLLQEEYERRESILKQGSSPHPIYQKMLLAADQFIVERENGTKSIIAGYPWFSDWGRDSMIALPGLCLATNRADDAKQILRTFAQHVNEGMIPNRFPDSGEQPEYNTIDATLWMFVAAYKYLKATADITFIEQELMEVFSDILLKHQQGTRYNIHQTEDGLLSGGAKGFALTWMDAKAGDWVVTPRVGKCVEINALWYNAWEILSFFHKILGNSLEGAKCHAEAKRIRKGFIQTFWNEEKGYLIDFVGEGIRSEAIRPNQIFAISLPFQLLGPTKSASVMDVVTTHLFTPRGLRSLSTEHAEYQGIYAGSVWQRDGAYHQGTVWGWLLGPYIDALIKVQGSIGKEYARSMIIEMVKNSEQGVVGSLAEIFDGQAPHKGKGCTAQAWTVSEVLRIMHEYELFGLSKPSKKIKRRFGFFDRKIFNSSNL